MTWKKLKTTKIFDHPRLQIFEDKVELPGGHKTDYIYFGNVPDVATIIAVNNDGQILLQKEYSHPQNEKLFQFPGGALEKGESPKQGAARELAEETGLAGKLTQIGWFYPDNRRKTQKMYVFVARNLREVQATKDIEEEFEDYWCTIDEINKKIKNNDICNYSALAGWSFFLQTN